MESKSGPYQIHEVILITGQYFPVLDLYISRGEKDVPAGWLVGINLKTNMRYLFNPDHVVDVCVFPDREAWAKAIVEAERASKLVH